MHNIQSNSAAFSSLNDLGTTLRKELETKENLFTSKKEYTLKIKASERGPSAQVASLEILSSGSVFRKSSPHDNGRKTAANKIKNILLFSFITTIFRRLGLRLY